MTDDTLCVSWVKGLCVTPSPCIAATPNPCLTVNLAPQSLKKDWNKWSMDSGTGKKSCNSLGFLNFSTVFVWQIQPLPRRTHRRAWARPAWNYFYEWFPPAQGGTCGSWGLATLVGLWKLCCPCSVMRKVKLEWNQPMRPLLAPVAVNTHCCIFPS